MQAIAQGTKDTISVAVRKQAVQSLTTLLLAHYHHAVKEAEENNK